MKLHLPVRLFKSVLACLTAVAPFSLGSGVAWAEAQNLTFSGSSLTWDTSAENKSFVDEEDAAASFAAGDNVSFSGESTVTLGENITAGTLDIAAGADVTIDLGNYTLHTDSISLSGTLAVGNSLSIASGSTLAVKNAAAVLDSALVLGEKSGLVVESSASLNHNSLTLHGGSNLILTAAGDGKTYTLLTGISSLVDKNGNTLTAGSYSINDYFDKDAPGSGFWADATLVYTADGSLQIVRHEENVQETLTFSTRQTSNLEYNYYEGISFKDIVYSTTSSSAYGGAIYGVGTITLNNNGRVTFSGNTVSNSDAVYGGAIYGRSNSTITLSNNGSVVFEGNTASSSSYSYFHPAYGGAIYGDTIMLSNNGSVVFEGNMASSSSSFPFSTTSSSPSAYGGAIYGDTIMLSNNGSVVFAGNTVSSTSNPDSCPNTFYAYGCAICGGDNSTIELSNNGCVQFGGNSTTSDSDSLYSCGGAIYGGDNSTIKLSNNGRVTFSDNTICYGGGAIYGGYDSTILLDNNASVEFSGNASHTAGGAILGEDGSFISLSSNVRVIFIGNKSNSSGAIDGDSISLNNNGNVEFTGNIQGWLPGNCFHLPTIPPWGMITGKCISLNNNECVTFSENIGGAVILGKPDSSITLSNNGSVAFSSNSAFSYSSFNGGTGGVIVADGNLSIQNNDFVIFEKNVEQSGSSYRLRSIYAGSSGNSILLSAAVGKCIEFREPMYIASGNTVNLNADYGSIEQKGDIIFSGATTEDDLYVVKGNVDGTEEEIRLSRTSEVLSMANLYNGRLIIKEGAIWSGAGITVDPVAGGTGKPTLLLQNGTLTHDASSVTNRNVVTIKSGGAFEVAGKSQADYTSLVLEGGSSWIFNIGSDNTAADSAVLSMENSSLTLPGSGKVTLQLNAATGVGNGKSYALLSGIEQPTDWSADSITVISGTTGWNVGFSDLTWADNTLWLYYDARPALVTATWTNESGDGKWNTTSVNWEQEEVDYAYKDGVQVVFGDEGAGTVDLVGELAPGSVLVNNAAGQDYTFGGSGSLTGNMKLTKKGAGNLTISTANSYTGGTVVNGGSLLAGHDKAFGTGDVAVHGATLDLNRYTIANKVRLNGDSTLGHADGASHIMLGGGSKVNFRDGFTLSSGKVLDVAAGGATYTGALTLGGGSIELDGKLTVEGAVTFESGTQTTLDISGWTAADDGTVLVDFGSSNSGYADGCLTLGGIAGDWELDFNATTGVLTLVAVKEDFRPNLDRNQQEVYDTMKDIMVGGNPGGVLGQLGQNIIGTRDEAELKRALDEISGREYATIMSSQMEGNMGHLRRLRAAAGTGTPLGEYVTFGCCYPSNKGVDKSDNKGSSVMIAPSPVIDSRRIRAGVSAFHEQGELDADSNGEGFERSETGAQLTMEYLVSDDFVFGMGLSHSRTKLTPTFGKRRDEDNTHFDLFGVYRSGRWSSTTSVGLGLHQHELGRTVAGMQTQAEADGLSVNFMQELAYSVYADEEQGLQVFGSVESSFNQVDAFSETGAGNASLCVEEQDAWVTDVTLGLRYNHTLPALGNAPAGMFSVQGGVVASLGDREHDASMRFAGAPGYSYKQYAAERSRWGYSVGASVNLPVSASTAVFGTAEAVLRNNAYTVDAQVGLKMAF